MLRTGTSEIAGDAPPAQPLLFDGAGAFVYAGADAATLRGPLYLQSASATVKMAAGAGPLTLDAPITWLASPSTLFLRGGTDRPLVLAGASWMLQNGGSAHQKVRLADGLFSLAPDLRLATGAAADVFRIGGTAEGERVRATIEDGARLDVAGLPVGAAQGPFAAADTVVTQRSARVDVKAGDVSLAPEKNFSRVAYVQEGGSLRVADGWLQFPCGLASFLLRGGVCAAPRASFGEGNGTAAKTYEDRPPATCLRVEGGSFEVGASFNWMGDAANARHNRMELAGGVATLPATRRSVAYDRRKRDAWEGGGNATLLFDGGTLALNGAAEEGASLDDYLFGVDALVVAGGGATVETPAADVAFSQPVEIGLSGAGDFVKRGPGALALTTTNRVLGAVKVEEGLLAAGFDTAPRFRYPDGLLALWDFDGEDPYADRTGHGYALAQRDVPGTGLVTFTDEAAHAGRSARMSGNGALQIVNCQGLNVRRFTVNLWVRPQQVGLGHQSYIAGRRGRRRRRDARPARLHRLARRAARRRNGGERRPLGRRAPGDRPRRADDGGRLRARRLRHPRLRARRRAPAPRRRAPARPRRVVAADPRRLRLDGRGHGPPSVARAGDPAGGRGQWPPLRRDRHGRHAPAPPLMRGAGRAGGLPGGGKTFFGNLLLPPCAPPPFLVHYVLVRHPPGRRREAAPGRAGGRSLRARRC